MLWEHRYQVIVFYEAGGQPLWPDSAIVSPWYDADSVDTLIPKLDQACSQNANSSRETFFVTQGIVTPDKDLITQNLLSSLKHVVYRHVCETLVSWVCKQDPKSGAVNIVIADFIEAAKFTEVIILLNLKK